MAIDENENKLGRRILVIDDNPAIHDDFRKILCRKASGQSLEADEAALFGTTTIVKGVIDFQLDTASQGQEGLEKVRAACAEGNPYALAFVDIRMPPGWDGVETISRIWKICPELQVVICTAYSDYSWEEIFRKVGQNDSLLILKKPFDNVEVLQLAHAMTRKWTLNQQAREHFGQLNRLVHERTVELSDANDGLTRTIRQLETAMDRASKNARDAEAANQAKATLFKELGTELRTSLPAINQLTEQLLSGELTATQRHQAEAIHGNCKALIDFAIRFVNSPKLEGCGLAPSGAMEFNVRNVVEQVATLGAPRDGRPPLSISIEIDNNVPTVLAGNPVRLTHTLSEMLEACAAQTRLSTVRIGVQGEHSRSDGKLVRFTVAGVPANVSKDAPSGGRTSSFRSGHRPIGAPSFAALRKQVEGIGGKLVIAGENDELTELALLLPSPDNTDSEVEATQAMVSP